MENLDSSLVEFTRDICTSVSEFSVSIDDDDVPDAEWVKAEDEVDSAELTTDYAKVSYTLAEVND